MDRKNSVRNARDFLQRSGTIDRLVHIFSLLNRDIFTASPTMTRLAAEMGKTFVVLGEGDGVILGAMTVRESLPWRRALEIDKIAVDADHQRQGIGRCLIEHAVALGIRGYFEDLEVVSHKDYKAEGFYEKCGFVQVYSDERCRGFKHSLRTPRA